MAKKIYKIAFSIFFLVGVALSSSSQIWTTVGVAGVDGVSGGRVNALCPFDSVLYVGGTFTFCANNTKACKHIAQWNGATWATVGVSPNDGISGGSNQINAMIMYNGKLIVAGKFTACAGATKPCNNIAQWDGTNWTTLGVNPNDGVKGGADIVYALAVYNGNLIVAGQFTTCGALTCNNIAQWNGAAWSVCGAANPNDGTQSGFAITAITTYNGEVVVGGGMNTCNGALTPCNNAAQWNGTNAVNSWKACGLPNPNDGINSGGSTITSMVSGAGFVFCGGTYTVMNGALTPCNHIAKWDGTNPAGPPPPYPWTVLGAANPADGVTGNGGAVNAMIVDVGLFCGGSFLRSGTAGVTLNNVGYYEPLTNLWTPVGLGANAGVGQTVYALASFGGNLFAAGSFTTMNGAAANACHEIAQFSGHPLPIQLNYFHATYSEENNDVNLNWATATEINNKEFTIQKSVDGTDWQPVVTVAGAGNTSITHYYSAIDETPYEGLSYYRVKQTDFDGTATASLPVAVNVPYRFTARAFPNPCTDNVTLQYNSVGSESVNITVMDLSGRETGHFTLQPEIQNGSNNYVMDISSLAPGIYLIKVDAGQKSSFLKIVKVSSR